MFYIFFSTPLVLCVFPSTRGSSDSIAPRDSLPPGIQEMKGSLIPFYMVQFMQRGGRRVSQVLRAELLLNQESSDCPHCDPELRDQKSTGRFVHSPKVKVLYAKRHSNPACFCVCAQILSIHSFIHAFIHSCTHPSMFIPSYMDTVKECKEKV